MAMRTEHGFQRCGFGHLPMLQHCALLDRERLGVGCLAVLREDALVGAVDRRHQRRIAQRAGKAPGILTPNEALARKYLELGCTFTAVGLDTSVLVQATSALAARFKQAAAPAPKSQTY